MSEKDPIPDWAERHGAAELRSIARERRERMARRRGPYTAWDCPMCGRAWAGGETCPECLERWAEELERRASR